MKVKDLITQLVCLLVIGIFGLVHGAHAQMISVNFHADDLGNASTTNPAAHVLDGTEAAGVGENRTTAWNNILVGNGGAPTGATIFASQSLTDNSGSAAASIASTLTAGTTSSWFVGYAASSAADEEELGGPGAGGVAGLSDNNLFNSYLALNGPSGDGSPADNFVLSVSGLGSEYTTNGFNLIIYSDTDRGAASNADRTNVFTVTPAGGSPTSVLTEDDGSVGGVFDGTYIRSNNADTNDTFSNYTVVSGLTSSSFTIEVTSPGSGGRGGISGFQIVALDEPASQPNQPGQPDGPNVVLFFVDDMGWADWEKYSDYYESPNMLRMANEGIEFTCAYASCSVCSPTRGSLMTGFSPAHHRITKWIPGNPDNDITNDDEPLSRFHIGGEFQEDPHYLLSQAMNDGGYHTAHMGKWHLGRSGVSADPSNFGYDVNLNIGNVSNMYFNYLNIQPTLDQTIDENFLTDHLAVEARNYINARVAAGERFFLNFNTNAPHTPIVRHPDHFDHFNDKPRGDFGHDRADYASMLFGVDKALGTILDALEDNGIRNETIVIFTSDHGGLTSPQSITSNAPFRGGKGQQWEGAHKVPFIITGPGIPSGVETQFQTITHDIYPSLLELTGVAGDEDHNALMEGISIAPAITDAGLRRVEPLFWHFPHESNHNGGPYGIMVNGRYKYIEVYDTGEQRLHDLIDDVDERNNIVGSNPEVAAQMRQGLHDYLREFDAALWRGQFQLLPDLPLGDFDRDGDVDGDDVDFYIGNLLQEATGVYWHLDLSGDGQVTIDDHDFHVTDLVTTSNGITGAPLGDVNLDGTVDVLGDAFDLIGFLGASATSRSQGDLNANGIVEVLGDAFLMIGQLGQSNF